MKNIIQTAVIALIGLALCGCSKIEIEDKDLNGTFWTGTLHNSSSPEDEFDSVSFDFHNGYADFTHLVYASSDAEEGVALYEASGTEITFSKANDMIDGTWTISSMKGEKISMARTHENVTLTIDIIKRR